MIQPVKAYLASDGSLHASIEKVQETELRILLVEDAKMESQLAADAACVITAFRQQVVDILTTGPRSRPARRTINGATTKKRKAKSAAPAAQPATPEQAAAGFAAAHAVVEEAA